MNERRSYSALDASGWCVVAIREGTRIIDLITADSPDHFDDPALRMIARIVSFAGSDESIDE